MVSVLCFSWNSNGLSICETGSESKAAAKRKTRFFPRGDCVTPDFFEYIRKVLNENKPDIVAISTQNEAKSSYFHSEYLINTMPELGYLLLSRENVYSSSDSTLRLSIYSKEKGTAVAGQQFYTEFPLVRGGAVICYVRSEIGLFAFIAVQFDGDIRRSSFIDRIAGEEVSIEIKNFDDTDKESIVSAYNEITLITLLDTYVKKLPEQPNYIFLLGDFASKITVPKQSATDTINSLALGAKIQDLVKQDNLYQKLRCTPSFSLLQEGVNNLGPDFVPTWNLTPGRGDKCSPQNNSLSQRCFEFVPLPGIGWRDRILYWHNSSSEMPQNTVVVSKQNVATITNAPIRCAAYIRLDIGNIRDSNHAGVLGFYTI